MVDDADADLPRLALRPHDDRRAGGRELRRVVQQVAQHLHHARLVHVDFADVVRHFDDGMLAALDSTFTAGITWTRPEGGMFVWIELPPEINGAVLLERAIREARVAFVPGAAFHSDRSGANTIRLSFSLGKPERIREGVGRLAGLLARW